MQKSTSTKRFEPLTSIRRIKDYELPKTIQLAGEDTPIPKRLRRKDISYTYITGPDGAVKLTRTCWMTQSLCHLLNAQRFNVDGELYDKENPHGSLTTYVNELILAKECALSTIARMIKDDVLKDKKGPGFMAFVQSNENVPVGSILITERTLRTFLVPHNKNWKDASKVIVTRFPNLGPNTTIELNLLVQKAPNNSYKENALTEQLKVFLDENIGVLEDAEDLMDPVFIHPDILKDCLQGDGDGDTVYSVISEQNGLNFTELSLLRNPGEDKLFEDEIEKALQKASRYHGKSISNYLPQLFDQSPIGPATYAIRMQVHQLAKSLKGTCDHPMHEAWKQVAPWAIELIEFVMDIRKGDYTTEQIQDNLNQISAWSLAIKKAKEDGCWFAKTVTTNDISSIEDFIETFPTLQDYADTIYVQ